MNKRETLKAKKSNADFVVIGGGGSGLTAALTAAERGIKNIVVVEKRNALGGNTAMATGLFGCESPVQARSKIVADKDEIFKKAMEWSHWHQVNPRIIRAFLNKSGDTISWLEQKGLVFSVIAFFPNQNPRVEHVAEGKGAQVIRVLEKECLEADVKILKDCTATGISIRDGNVTGITAIADGGKIEIHTRSVIIATGGFGGNKKLLKKKCRQYHKDMPVRGLPLMGDGIELASRAGAAIEPFIPLLKEGPRVDKNTWPLGGLEREPCTLWVNKLGKRFVDEATGSHPFEAVNQILYQPGIICYTLLDSRIRNNMLQKIPKLDQELPVEIRKGRVLMTDSLDEIAEWISANPATLASTIEDYNRCCDLGYDADFAKDRRNLLPIRVTPFYAIRNEVDLLDTLGGITINEHMEVLSTEGGPIPGLFAAGVTTSGWQSESYCSDLSGSAFGYAINSGRIAGENAAEYCKRSSGD
ncbi:MAG: FAD-dependent oxidoreductase [Desulfobacterales bacterium]|nr:FAD-dependent oxidoreductase [Desulfobacterales bacterium]